LTVAIKEWNFLVGSCGLPGSGKSHCIARRVAEEQAATGAHVLVHDPTGSYDTVNYQKIWRPNGGTRRYQDAHAALAGLASHAKGAHIIDCIDGADVLQAGIQLAAVNMQRQKRGQYHPVIVVLDEAVGAEGVDSHRLDREWLEAIVKRRHLGIGIAWTGQSCYVAHRALLMQSTELFIFRMVDPADHKRLISCGMTKEQVAEIAVMPDHHCYVLKSSRVVGKLAPNAKSVTPGEAPAVAPGNLHGRTAESRQSVPPKPSGGVNK
jgi:hypothetical protein